MGFKKIFIILNEDYIRSDLFFGGKNDANKQHPKMEGSGEIILLTKNYLEATFSMTCLLEVKFLSNMKTIFFLSQYKGIKGSSS